MRAGDALLLAVIGTGLVLSLIDSATGGGVSAWSQANLYRLAAGTASALGWLGLALSPLLLLPLIAALWGRFAALPGPFDRLLRIVIGVIDAVTTAIGDAARWFALGLVIVTAVVVVQRYVFGIAMTGLQESVIYMHALLFLLSSGITLLADGHVRVDIVYSKMTARGKAWTDLFGVYLALIPMGWLILVMSSPYVNASWRILERSRESDGLAFVFLLKAAIPVFAVMLILQGISMAAQSALTISGRPAPAHPRAVEREL
ncbi:MULTISPECIES: TRAP transporter small permease subunit [Hyphobacterium]|uniref:TRAP transporter small permease protein n=1 Tax=Hyphobacterium vulgare TaxID=1736751 RepID=A0ABV6ZTG1_9PROT